MKTTVDFSIGELFDERGYWRKDRLINASRMVKRADTIIARDTMTGARIVLWGSAALRTCGETPPWVLVIDGDFIHADDETQAEGRHVAVELAILREAIEETKGQPCEHVWLD